MQWTRTSRMAKTNFVRESAAWQHAFLLHLEALLDTAAALGGCYAGLGQYEDARYTLTTALALIETVFRDGDAASPLQVRERGDLYALAAGRLSAGRGRRRKRCGC